ncbi:hypothetical protein T439DRAFT_376572 [Meredithblackwellia eburnea MCA 4105]
MYTNLSFHAWVGSGITQQPVEEFSSLSLKDGTGNWTPSVASSLYNGTNGWDIKQVWFELVCASDSVAQSGKGESVTVINPNNQDKCSWEGPMPAAKPDKGCPELDYFGHEFSFNSDTEGNACEPVKFSWTNQLVDKKDWRGVAISVKSYIGDKLSGGQVALDLQNRAGTYTPSVSDAVAETSTNKKVWFKLYCGMTEYASSRSNDLLTVKNPKNLKKCSWE